jgi:hypothetical protein
MVSAKDYLVRPRPTAARLAGAAASPALDEATAWLRGEGDLLTAGMGRPVPVVVQIGVLAHADLERLANLGRYCRRGSVRRAWGTPLAALAGELAGSCKSPEDLRNLQAQLLIPLEDEVLAGRRCFANREQLISHLRAATGLSSVK